MCVCVPVRERVRMYMRARVRVRVYGCRRCVSHHSKPTCFNN